MKNLPFLAYWVTEESDGSFKNQVIQRSTDDLQQNGVLIKVAYSSLNYKDALSATGNKGVTRRYPHTPGIDAAGIVVESSSDKFQPGDQVIVTGYDLGMNTAGGFGEYINVPAEWVVSLPDGLSLKESMILGTAGFTAALSVHHLLRCRQKPEEGPLLVTGATGGVGSISVAIASKLGFNVTASSGKTDQHEYLKKLGAQTIISRTEVDDQSGRMLLRPQWAAAIDTVGGNTLATILKSLKTNGNVASCGNVSSPQLNTSVFPFILNGVNLLGVNSATTPMDLRLKLWDNLANAWKPDFQHIETKIVGLNEIHLSIEKILKGGITGRVVLEHSHNSK
ncbi:MAG: YhdH/YhfP family quinone oxidoreductase [Bacteroidales bacterium]|nr:YhdH/YhfP family quinone oxidoreductase [Bacteroidales bacterium]